MCIIRQWTCTLTQLPARYRGVVELRHYQDLSYDEIAEALNTSLSTVKSDLFRARKMLVQALGETGE